MEVKQNITVYVCDFCKKKSFRKHSMVKHEEFCSSNPKNFKACSGCTYLKEIEILYYVPRYDNDGDIYDEERKTKGFECTKLDKTLYPLKVEKLKLNEKYPETFEEQEPMPKECVHNSFDEMINIFG